MRFWNRATEEKIGIAQHKQPRPRIRNSSQGDNLSFGQRPPFSDCLAEESYSRAERVPLGPEIDVDETHPEDRTPGSAEDKLRKADVVQVDVFYISMATSNPPTDEELDAAFGTQHQRPGFLGILLGTGDAYLVTADKNTWFYETLTSA